MLDEVLNKTKETISIRNFDDNKILVDTDNKLADDITLENIVILMRCVIKNDSKFYQKTFSIDALLRA